MGIFRQFPYSNFHEMNMDEIIKIVKNMLEEWAQYYDTWEDWKDTVTAEWAEMQNFINNYFDNLDVQNEINNKIISMVHSGEFSAIVDPYVPPAVADWLAEHITTPETVVIDDSLTIEGACADAKATGDAILDLKNDLNNTTGAIALSWEQGGIDSTTGAEYSTTVNVRTAMVNAEDFPQFMIIKPTGTTLLLFAHEYDANNVYKRMVAVTEKTYTPQYPHIRFRATYDPVADVTPETASLTFTLVNIKKMQDLAWNFGEVIPANSDLNTYVVPGEYNIATQSSVASISNCPSPYAGRLIVLYINTITAYGQIFIDTRGNIYSRSYSSGAWLPWRNADDKPYEVATTISANSDLNTYTTNGTFRIASQSAVASIAHCPSPFAGRLSVMTLNGSSAYFQIYLDTRGYIYSRSYSSGAWLPWRTADDKFADSATAIPANSDFNSYTSEGTFKITLQADVVTIANCPSLYAGRLVVMTLNSSGAYYQIYLDTRGHIFSRAYTLGAWLPWVGEADSNEIAMNMLGAMNTDHEIKKSLQYSIALANGIQPLCFKNYKQNNQNVHPKVLYFSNEFGGHKYWMAYTPYPNSNDTVENPCVAYSDDGFIWTNIDSNPLSDPKGNGYNSDTHLVYRSDTGVMECWYRYVGPSDQSPREETIYRRTTTDGVTWTAEELIFSNTSGNYSRLLSPAVIFENNKYCIWVVENTKIVYYEAPANNVNAWSLIREYSLSFTDGGINVNPWHIDVIKDSSTYIILVMCRNGTSIANNHCSLFITTSSDNETYSAPTKVVEGSAHGWDRYMYRSSIVKIGSLYRIYYSAGTGGKTNIYNNSIWGIGITESATLNNFIGY